MGNCSTWLPCVERSTAHPLVLHSLARRTQGGLSHASQLVPVTSYQKNQIYSWCPCLWGYISQLCVDMLLCPSPWGPSPQVRFSTTQPPGTQEPHERARSAPSEIAANVASRGHALPRAINSAEPLTVAEQLVVWTRRGRCQRSLSSALRGAPPAARAAQPERQRRTNGVGVGSRRAEAKVTGAVGVSCWGCPENSRGNRPKFERCLKWFVVLDLLVGA